MPRPAKIRIEVEFVTYDMPVDEIEADDFSDRVGDEVKAAIERLDFAIEGSVYVTDWNDITPVD